MDKLLVIADDFTGALDTGVQFAAVGAATRVVTGADCDWDQMEAVQVLVVDTESRHMMAREAYGAVFRTVRSAMAAGFNYIYKKTDSALRGNVGAELAAVQDGVGEGTVAFLPALPNMDRVTRRGVHYINGVPVAESVFGRDPFEPVRVSSVADIIGQQTAIPVTVHGVGEDGPYPCRGIHVYDAATEEDLRSTARRLREQDRLRVLAGCAGMASVLPELMQLGGGDVPAPALRGDLLTICGSVNPITRAQLDAAERAGALRLTLTPEQKLDPGWAASAEGQAVTAAWAEQIKGAVNAIVECGANDRPTQEHVARLGLSLEQTRQRIAAAMGGVLRRLLDLGVERDLLVTGGDTLLAFMHLTGQDTLIPLGEIQPGVVLSRIRYGGRDFNLMSKSGGFGTETLLADLTAGKNS